jgi:hypothetical protein
MVKVKVIKIENKKENNYISQFLCVDVAKRVCLKI